MRMGKGLKIMLASILLGFVLGASSMVLVYSERMDKLFLERAYLNIEMEKQSEELARLKNSISQNKWRLINDVTLHLSISEKDEHALLKIKQLCMDILKDLIGKNLDNTDPMLVYHMLNGRSFNVNNTVYHVKIDFIIMAEHLEVFAASVKEDSPDERPSL